MYPYSWSANENNLEDQSGDANFIIDGKDHHFQLESFTDCQRIAAMLDVVFDQGRSFGASTVLEVMMIAGKRRVAEFAD